MILLHQVKPEIGSKRESQTNLTMKRLHFQKKRKHTTRRQCAGERQ